MRKIETLQEKAQRLRSLLEKYAMCDSDAEMVLGFMLPLFKRIDKEDIVIPCNDRYRWYFANADSPLYKYDELCNAAAEFAHVLQDWPPVAN